MTSKIQNPCALHIYLSQAFENDLGSAVPPPPCMGESMPVSLHSVCMCVK